MCINGATVTQPKDEPPTSGYLILLTALFAVMVVVVVALALLVSTQLWVLAVVPFALGVWGVLSVTKPWAK
jgi:hypothetical protein